MPNHVFGSKFLTFVEACCHVIGEIELSYSNDSEMWYQLVHCRLVETSEELNHGW